MRRCRCKARRRQPARCTPARPYIERVDRLVQLVAKSKGRSSPVLDETVKLVDAQLEKNRTAQAKPAVAAH